MAHRPGIDERAMRVAGTRTRVLETAGDEQDRTPILFLHGYSDSADTWQPVLELLARRGQRAAAIDLPGFGAADRLRPGEPMLEQYVELVPRIGALLWPDDPPLLVGNSMGGAVALLCAQRRPAPAGIVPIGPAGFDHPGWFRVIERQPLLRYALNDTVRVPAPVLRVIVGEIYRRLAYASPQRARREDLVRFTQHYTGARDVRRLLSTGRRLLPELARPFDLTRIACPVLLVWGERDRMVSARGSRHLLDALPDTRYELLRGAGHCPQLEVPETVADLVMGFRAQIAAAEADAARLPS